MFMESLTDEENRTKEEKEDKAWFTVVYFKLTNGFILVSKLPAMISIRTKRLAMDMT